MKISAKGIALLKKFEGCELKAYKDAVGVWTIGYGHTSAAGAPKVTADLTISQAQAEDILVRDLAKYEAGVERAVKVPLNQHQFDALVSWHYNTGAIAKASLTKKLNAGDYDAVPGELKKWNKAKGKVLAGLTRRRAAEAKLWSTAVPVPKPAPKPVDDKATVTRVQERLTELGYFEVGKADGKAGRRTEAAILAFRHDQGLPLVVAIDDDLLAALMTAPPRVVAKERATATASELREEGSTIMSGAATQQVVGGVAATGAVAEGVSRSGVLDTLTGAGEKVEEVTEVLSPFQALIAFLSDYIWVAFLIIGGIVGWTGWQIAKARLADHRSGKTPTTGPGTGSGAGS